MAALHVHEFITLDGVIDTPSWTFPYGFDPKMAERLAAVTGRSKGIRLGRTTFELFAKAWPTHAWRPRPPRRPGRLERAAEAAVRLRHRSLDVLVCNP